MLPIMEKALALLQEGKPARLLRRHSMPTDVAILDRASTC